MSKDLDFVTSPFERLRRARLSGTSMRGLESVQKTRARASGRETKKTVQKVFGWELTFLGETAKNLQSKKQPLKTKTTIEKVLTVAEKVSLESKHLAHVET